MFSFVFTKISLILPRETLAMLGRARKNTVKDCTLAVQLNIEAYLYTLVSWTGYEDYLYFYI